RAAPVPAPVRAAPPESRHDHPATHALATAGARAPPMPAPARNRCPRATPRAAIRRQWPGTLLAALAAVLLGGRAALAGAAAAGIGATAVRAVHLRARQLAGATDVAST